MIVFAGCGALGSQIALNIADPEHEYVLIDDDRVGPENIGTSAYLSQQIGMWKADALAELLYRKGVHEIEAYMDTLDMSLYDYFGPASFDVDLAIDTFDNGEARSLTSSDVFPVIHVGVGDEHTGHVTWDEVWAPDEDSPPRGENPVCTHLLGRPILRFTAAVAAGVIEEFLETGQRRSLMVTKGLSIYG
jgi:hypothetical protein